MKNRKKRETFISDYYVKCKILMAGSFTRNNKKKTEKNLSTQFTYGVCVYV